MDSFRAITDASRTSAAMSAPLNPAGWEEGWGEGKDEIGGSIGGKKEEGWNGRKDG